MAVLWNYSVSTGVPIDLISNGKGSSFFIYNNASHFYLESVNESNGNINWVVDLGTSPKYSGWESKLDFNSDGNLLLSFNGNVNTYSYSNGAILISPPIEIGYGNYALTDTGLIQTIGVSNSAYYSGLDLPNNTGKITFNNGISTVYKTLLVGLLAGSNNNFLYTNDLYKNTNGEFIVQTRTSGTSSIFLAYSDATINIYRKTDYAYESWSPGSSKSYSFNAPSSGYYLITDTLGSQVNIANTQYNPGPSISLIYISAPGNFNISVSPVSNTGLYVPAGSFYQVYAQKVDYVSNSSAGTFLLDYKNDGTYKWALNIDSSKTVKKIIPSVNGDFYVIGTKQISQYSTAINCDDIFIEKYSSLGAQIWAKTFDFGKSDGIFDGAVTNSGDYLIVAGHVQTEIGTGAAGTPKYLNGFWMQVNASTGVASAPNYFEQSSTIDSSIQEVYKTPSGLEIAYTQQSSSTTANAAFIETITLPNTSPTGSVTITGTNTQGQTLTASNNIADADGLGVISYQWKAAGVNISGATSSTYTLTQAEVGKAISVVASYTDLQGASESLTSASTNSVVNINDLPTGSVTITGTAKQGQTLTASNSLADVDGLGAITYTWKANGVTIGAGTTYKLTRAEEGKTITATAGYTDLQGTPEAVVSAASGVVIVLPQVSVNVSPFSVNESGASNLTYAFARTGDVSSALTVNLQITGTSITTDYTSPLNPTWTKLLGGAGANALTTGIDGSIYVSGNTSANLDGQINSGSNDAFITKYLPDGTKSWTKLVGSSAGDTALALTTGADGSIYVGGFTSGTYYSLGWASGNLDGQTFYSEYSAFIIKYLPDGTKSWTSLLGGSSNAAPYSAVAYALTAGKDGSIYVGGITYGNLEGQTYNGGSNNLGDVFITKYLSNGSKSWTKLLGTTSADGGAALTTGADGSIYVSGFTCGNLDGQINSGSNDAFITKYLPDGTKSWTKLLGTSSIDTASRLATGTDGSIYVCGSTYGNLDGQINSGSNDAFITKYLPDGTKSWTKLLGTSSDDAASGLTIGTDGAIYVSGYTTGNLDGQAHRGGAWDAFVAKYLPDGTKSWTKLIGTNSGENAAALTTGADGALYVGGFTGGNLDGQINTGAGSDAFISRYPVTLQEITFAAGSSTATLVIDPTPDLILEGNETVVVSIAQSTAYDLGATSTVTGTIVDTIRFLGGSGADTFIGNHVTDTRNNFVGGGGNDDITGDSRADVAEYSGNLNNYTIAASNGLITITDSRTGSSYDGTDTLHGINLLNFADGMEFVGLAAVRVALTGSEVNHTMQVTESKLYSGTNAVEKFVIGANVSSMILAGEGDTVHLAGSFTDYIYASRGSELQIAKGDFMTTVNLAGNVSIETDLGHGLNAYLDFTQATPRVMLDTQLVVAGSIDSTLLNTHAVL